MGADTIVVCNGRILGKPEGRGDALKMLSLLSDNRHQVLSAVALVDEKKQAVRAVTTEVNFRALTKKECEDYWLTGEPCDKAGGYGIQGLGAVFVSHIEGSYSAVVGLPIAETVALLKTFGVPVWNVLQGNL